MAKTKPDSLATRIRAHLLTAAGPQRPADIATALGIPDGMTKTQWSQRVANTCARMANPAPGRKQTLVAVDPADDLPWKRYRLPQIGD